jgi:RNA polymerase sigma-70 factor, ECF subfamily
MNPSDMNQEDQSLIRQTLDGNQSAFGELVRKYQQRLYRGLYNIINHESETEDVIQEAFVLAYTKLHTFRGGSRFYTWLYRIGYNVAISHLRRQRKWVSLDQRQESNGDEIVGEFPTPGHRMEQEELSIQIEKALGQLSLEHRSILVLREIEELDYEAISEILDLPIGTVRSRLHRAREQLRENLQNIDQQNKVG